MFAIQVAHDGPSMGKSSIGMVFTLVRDIPAYAAFFGSYSVIKESVHENSRKYF